jgi:hypothetical protein
MKTKREISSEESNSLLIYEGDIIHHFKATDLSYVMIVITFVSCFISLLERHTKPSLQLETAKRKPSFREERKNEEIISKNCLPHHKRASSFTNTDEATQLHFLPVLSRYSRMSESMQHDEHCPSLHDRWCFRYDEQCSSLHVEGLKRWELLIQWPMAVSHFTRLESSLWNSLCIRTIV